MLLDRLHELHDHQFAGTPDAEIQSRIDQYEMAFRMQTSIPDVTDLSKEPKEVLDLYGPDVHKPGTFAANCLMARRLAERGVRFVQLYHQDWDHHSGLPGALPPLCRETDQPAAGLVIDLERAGCSKTRWWSGAASSGGRTTARGRSRRTSAGTITPAASRCGWPAAA